MDEEIIFYNSILVKKIKLTQSSAAYRVNDDVNVIRQRSVDKI